MCRHFLIGILVVFSTLANAQFSFQKILEPSLTDTLLVGHVIAPLVDQSAVLGMTILTLDQSVSILQLRPTLLRLSATGEVLWNKVYRNGQENFFPDNIDVIPVNNSTDVLSLIVGSSFSSPNLKETFLVKIDQQGNKIWDKRIEGFTASNVIQQLNGNLQISLPVNASSSAQGVVTMNENGELIWARQLSVDWINRMTALSDGSTILSCFSTDDPILRDIYNQIQSAILVRLDANGNLIWAKTSEDLYALDIQELANGDLIVSGFSPQDNQPRLARINQNGDPIWYKRLDLPMQSRVANLEITPNNEIIVYSANSNIAYITKLSEAGDVIWTRELKGSTDDEFGKPFALMPDGGFRVTAYDSTQNTYLTGLDENGRIISCLNSSYCFESEPLALSLTDISIPLQVVSVNITNSNGRLIDFQATTIDFCSPSEQPIAFFEAQDTICTNNLLTIETLPENRFDRYEWIFEGGMPSSASTLMPPPVTYAASGQFEIQLITELSTCPDTFIQQIQVSMPPDINLGNDTTLCKVTPLTLDATQLGAYNYLWENGFTSPRRTIENAGNYSVEVTNAYCSATDSITIQLLEDVLQRAPIEFNISPDSVLCLGTELLLEVTLDEAITAWEWEDGSQKTQRLINNAGNYIVTALVDDCPFEASLEIQADDCRGAIYIPNIFSPNGDNINDLFFPETVDVEVLSLRIFNRWGNIVFESTSEPWNGNWNSNLAPEGSYAYSLLYKDNDSGRENTVLGWITLVR